MEYAIASTLVILAAVLGYVVGLDRGRHDSAQATNCSNCFLRKDYVDRLVIAVEDFQDDNSTNRRYVTTVEPSISACETVSHTVAESELFSST